jgi:hypothetical protein
MSQISSYPILSNPTLSDLLIGTDVDNLNLTKNFSISSIGDLIGLDYVPYTGALQNVNLGSFNITSSAFIVGGGTSSQFLKANGTLDSTVYVPATRTITINSVGYDLSANRSWDLNTINSLTTTGTSGAATYVGKVLNIPIYQAQGNYITQLSGEATAVGPGNAVVTLDNTAVISKVLTGLNVTGGNIIASDTILQAFGKVQNQINGLVGGVQYQGTWNAATNTPTLQSSVGTKGHYYVVSVPGNTNLNGITDWKLGDWAIYDGTAWQKVDNTDSVISVNGYTGEVILTYSDVGAPPSTRTLTINGVGYDLSANRAWTVGDVRTDSSYANPSWITSLAWSKITSTPTTLAGYGITDGVNTSRTLTINGTSYDLSANRTWSVGTVTSIATSGPITGGPITVSGTIGITQSGATSDGYLSSSDWNAFNNKQEVISVSAPLTFVSGVVGITQAGSSSNGYLSSTDWTTFNNKQNALVNPVTGTGTLYTLPMWGGATSLVNSPLSYGSDSFNFQYNSTTGASVVFSNIGLTPYSYTVTMNNFGSPRSTVHSYTDGIVYHNIAGTQYQRIFANGNTIIGQGLTDTGYKLYVEGEVFINSVTNAATDPNKYMVWDTGSVKYVTASQMITTLGAVPYTGATANVNLGEFGLTTGYLGFDLTPTNTPVTQGTMYWDDSELTVALNMGTVTQHIGEDVYYNVKNSSGANIPKGTAVRFAGTDGNSGHILIAPFLADGTYPSAYFMGVTAASISNGSFGKVVQFGKLEGVNTNSFTSGAILYASTTVAGGFQTTVPVAPDNIVQVAAVLSSANNGKIMVRPILGSNITQDEGVVITSPVLNQGLFYDSGLWVNKTIASALGYTPANQATTLTINGSAYDLSSNRSWSVGTVTSVNMSVPTGFAIGGNPVTSSGTLALSFASGYSLPTDASQSNWDVAYNNRITSLNTTPSSGAATLIGNVLTIPVYQEQGNYITSLTGEATASGPGAASVTLTNSAVTGKILTGLSVAGSSISATDSILAAFGKLQGQINDLIGGLQYQGTWNASTNTPTITSGVGTDGHFYIVSVAGNTTIDGITDWQIGDWIVFHGTAWQKVDNTESVVSVNGLTGAVNLTTSNISEGTNLYFTNSRARQAISLTTTGSSGASTYDNGTGVLNVPQYTLSGLGGVPTTRTLTINGTSYDLSADRSWTIVAGITGSGTTNYISKFSASDTIANSLLFDNGSGVGLGTASINASALFQMDSTTKGFLPPRMTAAQRGSISSPAEGLIVYQTDSVIGLYIYSNSTWRSLTMV